MLGRVPQRGNDCGRRRGPAGSSALRGSLGVHLAIAAVLCDEPRGGSLLGEMTPVPTLHLVLIFVGLAVLARGVGWLVSGASPRVTRPVT